MKKKLCKLEVGKCYRIIAYEAEHTYRIQPTTICSKTSCFAKYRTKIGNRYSEPQEGGLFIDISKITPIKSL